MAKFKKCTVKSPANIAFIKYWGKTNPKTRIPANNSISMCISELFSLCSIEFQEDLKEDVINFVGEKVVTERELGRIKKVLDRVREKAGISCGAKIVTKNNFPKATGIASSASGLSSVTMAALGSAGIELEEKELSMIARLASGTACRSIPDGFVEWVVKDDDGKSYSQTIHPVDYWDICDVTAIVTKKMKKISSTKGHSLANTSPFYHQRLEAMHKKVDDLKQALKDKDFTKFGTILEYEALNMHAICITSTPPILYWERPTMTLMKKITEWREDDGLEVYYTIDAGPTVHAICQGKDAEEVAKRMAEIKGVDRVAINNPAPGARFVDNHLF